MPRVFAAPLAFRRGFAALEEDLRAPAPLFFAAAGFAPVDRDLLPVVFARGDAVRERLALRAPPLLLRADPRDVEAPALLAPLAPSSLDHLPDITRCAASATASAINEPSFVALDIMLLAAWLAVSAASSPASRMARRAFGLALIAAAAAAKPAASISLLIAAFASLSTVVSLLLEEERVELLRVDLAMLDLPRCRKDTSTP